MPDLNLNLEIGKTYLNLERDEVEILRKDTNGFFVCDENLRYRENGECIDGYRRDNLIEEYKFN